MMKIKFKKLEEREHQRYEVSGMEENGFGVCQKCGGPNFLHSKHDEEHGAARGPEDANDDGELSGCELKYHFDLNGDGKVTPDEYVAHIKWHMKHPESLENMLRDYHNVQDKKDDHDDADWTEEVALDDASLEEGQDVCLGCLQEYMDFHSKKLNEAKYHGRNVPLGKPMRGDVKKFKVFVRDPKTGNIKKVNFGDKKMRIKKSNPKRRKSFRARHNCANPGPRTKARYWSCRKW